MDGSERYKEASKTYQLDEEWNLRFDDGQPDLFEKEYQRIPIKEDEAKPLQGTVVDAEWNDEDTTEA
jgi:hypothetical protein